MPSENEKEAILRAQIAALMLERDAAAAALLRERDAAAAALLRERDAAAAAAMRARLFTDAAAAGLSKLLQASEKRAFIERFLGMASSSAADSRSDVDEVRRGAPAPRTIAAAALLSAAPATDAAAAWRCFCEAQAREWVPPAAAKLDENKDVHPTLERLFAAAAPPALRLWRTSTAEDDIAAAQIEPDFLLTAARDASAALLGARLVAEVKLPGELPKAESQARIYLHAWSRG